jgi:hypothetical protein
MNVVDSLVTVCAILGSLLGSGGILGIAMAWGRVRQKIDVLEDRNRRLTQMYDDFQKMHGECLNAQRARFDRILEELGEVKTGMAVTTRKFEDFLKWAYRNGHGNHVTTDKEEESNG